MAQRVNLYALAAVILFLLPFGTLAAFFAVASVPGMGTAVFYAGLLTPLYFGVAAVCSLLAMFVGKPISFAAKAAFALLFAVAAFLAFYFGYFESVIFSIH